MSRTIIIALVASIAAGAIILSQANPLPPGKAASRNDTLVIGSAVFTAMDSIPSRYACDGADVSPPLSWRGVPAAAKSIALIVDDPDAPGGTWVHWVVYDLPPGSARLDENIPKIDTLRGGGKQGVTDFRRVGYNGPCPPGGTHRYFFKLYALDIMLNLPSGKAKKEIEKAMKGHIIANAVLVGTYTKKNK
jgi:Raf kinase inhibitor-like YbhB/YbcL family protein